MPTHRPTHPGVIRHLAILAVTAVLALAPLCGQARAQGFETAKYGSDFLGDGIGARASGMGGAQAAVANDVTAGFWNPAGLSFLTRPDLMLMRSERFSGTVAFDVAAIAIPLGFEPGADSIATGALALTLIRQGVDGIPNTLEAWDPDRGLPREDAESYITRFNVTDMVAMLSYASPILRAGPRSAASGRSAVITAGGSVKVARQRIGPFADAWGYSLDLGVMVRKGPWMAGAMLADATTMLKFWDVDPSSLSALETDYGDSLPTGSNEAVLPRLRLGAARRFVMGSAELLATADIDVAAEGRAAYALNAGRFSFSPHAGIEASWRGRAHVRAGVTDLVTPPDGRAAMSPTVGAGLVIGSMRVDYGFSDFSGYATDLGVSHRISLGVRFR